MLRACLVSALALLGAAAGLWMALDANAPSHSMHAASEPARPPFQEYLAGAGIIEASTQNIAVATPRSGVIETVPVRVGQRVEKGEVLFALDSRQQVLDLDVKRATLRLEEARLERLIRPPRREDVAMLEAQVREGQATRDEAQDKVNRTRQLSNAHAISVEERARAETALLASEARLARIRTELAKLKAGNWQPDIEIARRTAEVARNQVEAAEEEVRRLTIRAPLAGTVLEVNARVGEFAESGPTRTPLIILGETNYLHLRVDIDENDAWRLRPGDRAVAFVRGNRELRTNLEFVRVQPLVVGKRSLTGESNERVDTRVLQVIYRLEPSQLPLYVGQQMDVFIEVSPASKPVAPSPSPAIARKDTRD